MRSITRVDETLPVARTDDTGRFQLQGMFELGGRLHVSFGRWELSDSTEVCRLSLPALCLRSPLELTLLPALGHVVTVLSEGRPVTGAHVAAVGTDFHVQGVIGTRRQSAAQASRESSG